MTRALHFPFALGPTSYVADPVEMHVTDRTRLHLRIT